MVGLLSGIDVSSAQGLINWPTVAASKQISFAFCKATEGTEHIDPQFYNNWSGIKKQGFVRGAYHFARTQNDPVVEAKHFVSTIQSTNDFGPGDMFVLDIEISLLTGKQFYWWLGTWLETVEQLTNIKPLIYSGGLFFNQHIMGLSAEEIEYFAEYDFWLAAYVNNPKIYTPAPWANKGWRFWQRSGDQAAPGDSVLHLPGINGNVDHDQFMGTLNDLQTFAASLYQVPQPIVQPILSIPAADPESPPIDENIGKTDPETTFGFFSSVGNFFQNLFKK